MKLRWKNQLYTLIAAAMTAMMMAPGRVWAQIPPNKLDPAIPRISQSNSQIPAYLLSGLALILVVLITFRSAHRGARRGGRDESA